MTQFSMGSFTPVADGIFTAVAEPAGVNIGLVQGDSGVLIIDTGSAPAQGAAIKAAAQRFTGLPVVAVAVTHSHYDHFFGLAGFAGLPSFGHESLGSYLASPDASTAAAELGVALTDLASPKHTFSLAKVIDAGGRRVEALHFGPGHTSGDVAIYVPDADVVFAGDLLESDGGPDFGTDCNLKAWPMALDGILGLVTENTVVVPGHGPSMDRITAFTQRANIAGFYGLVENLLQRGVKLEDAYSAAKWPFDQATVTAALPVAYAQLRAAGVGSRRQLPLL
jgi:glyoxylase-like metal-dependent hydrolase (beta-lactamase superfamily II)